MQNYGKLSYDYYAPLIVFVYDTASYDDIAWFLFDNNYDFPSYVNVMTFNHIVTFHHLMIMHHNIKNIATGETSQAITPFHFFDYFDFSNFYQ